MSWVTVVELREEFVKEALEPEANISDLCRDYGISRKSGYKWIDRYLENGLVGLRDLSRKRKSQERTSDKCEREVLVIRQEHPDWGGATIGSYLQRKRKGYVPCARTIDRILRRNDQISDRVKRHKYPESKIPKAYSPNDIWSSDFKGWWTTKDEEKFEPLTIRDSYSRYILKALALEKPTIEAVKEVYIELFMLCGLPLNMLTDNGSPFANRGICGLTKLSVWWIKLGISLVRIPLGQPYKNGSHERMHRDLNWLRKDPAKNRVEQQKLLNKWTNCYNHVRPHHALEFRSPADLYKPSNKKYSDKIPNFDYPDQFIDIKIDPHGYLKYRNEKVFFSEALANEQIALQILPDKNFAIWFRQYLLAKTLNKSFQKITPIFKKAQQLIQ